MHDGSAPSLRPYVPRLLIDWLLDAPEARHRAMEGSLAFADIAGFTALTERLARKGKIGAEEMSGVLDACFTELLSVASEYGADLVKWGGDAILLLFRGADDAARACRAASELHAALRRLGRIQTSAGSVLLRMSVGIHSGSFDFFIAGRVHRELVVTGPAATRTVTMEQTAEAGEIALSPEAAARLDPRVLGPRKGDAVLLRRAPRAQPAAAEPARELPDGELARCFSDPVRRYLVRGGAQPEHRPVTAAFVEFRGVDRLREEDGVAAVADALDECITTVQQAAQRHGVTFLESDIGADGGKIMLVAGAPTTAGNDSERMLRTVRAVLDAGARLPLRAGVSRGRVFAGELGPSFRRTYSVKGDAVNLAARLTAKAESGQIVATEEVVNDAGGSLAIDALEPFAVKGKAQPVRALVVGRALAPRRAGSRTPLVGRERELGELLAALESARDWEGGAIEVVGDAGVGKSRLLEELCGRAPGEGFSVVAERGEEYDAATPYAPFGRLLRRLLDLGDDLSGDAAALLLHRRAEELAPNVLQWLPLVGLVLRVEVPETQETALVDETFRKARLEEAVRELLGTVLAGPTVVVLEDVHWLDEASADLLTALLAGIELRPWLVVASRRDEGAGGQMKQLVLEPLSADSAAALVDAATAEAPLPPHEVDALVQRSGGNPLFVRELLAAAREAAGVEALPDSVEALLAARIDRVPPRERSIVRCASVLGMSFDLRLLAAALDEEPPGEAVWERLSGLVAREGEGGFRFRHALVRDAAYEGLPYRVRRELHSRVGAAIERLADDPADEAERLSLHFFNAGRFEEAWRYSRLAGDRAAAVYANNDAATFYERALESVRRFQPPPREVACVWEALGDMRSRLGEFDRARAAYRAARDRHADASELVRFLLKEARIAFTHGRYVQAVRWIRRGLRELEGAGGEAAAVQRVRLYTWHGAVRLQQGRPRETVDWCWRAIDEGKRVDENDALAHAYYVLDYALFSLGRVDEAVYSPRALEIYERLGNLSELGGVLNNLGMFAYYRGSWNEALDYYRRAEEAWEKAGNRWAASFAIVNRAEILSDQGRLEEAEPLLRATLRVARASRAGPRVADIATHYGRLAARGGRFDEAHPLLQEARQEYEQGGAQANIALADARIAEALMLQGRAHDACASALEALQHARSLEGLLLVVPLLHRVRGSALLQLGELADARIALTESVDAARAEGADYEVALALSALAALGRYAGEDTEPLETEAREIFERLGVVRVPDVPLPKQAVLDRVASEEGLDHCPACARE